MPSWAALLRQRLRWMRGVAALPRRVQVGLVLFSGYWLALTGLLVAGRPLWALGALAFKIAAQALMLRVATRRAGLPMPGAGLVVGYEFFALALITHASLSRLFGPRGVDWKGRRYH
jgi:hypothetical protein